MEHNKTQQHQHGEQVENIRDDLTWTQYITNLAANKLAPPKSQTLKVLEDHLTRLSEELLVRGESRLRERIKGGDTTGNDTELENRAAERSGGKDAGNSQREFVGDAAATSDLDVGLTQASEAPALAFNSVDVEKFSFSGGHEIGRPVRQVQQLNQELMIGNRWIDVLWQFIAAHQKRLIDPERLGIEPSERMDIQVDMIRQIAATYEKLGLLTRLPDSLSEARECKMVDDIRTMALVYVARGIMDVSSPKEIADANDDENEFKKQIVEFPRSVISPYEGIRPIEFDPMTLIMGV